ncbi:hypothetical protein [Microbacterium xylanilyticum]
MAEPPPQRDLVWLEVRVAHIVAKRVLTDPHVRLMLVASSPEQFSQQLNLLAGESRADLVGRVFIEGDCCTDR